jgi:concentrative nucleoside transporter, CNT family
MSEAISPAPAAPPPSPARAELPPTPLSWRLAIAAAVLALGGLAWLLEGVIGMRGRALLGAFCFVGIAALFSSNLRAVSWRTLLWGVALQVVLALFVLSLRVGDRRPGYELFEAVGAVVNKFLEFSNHGAEFVFGQLANPAAMNKVFPPNRGFVFAFSALPTIIFVSSFFTVLYYFGVLQLVVRLFARGMMYLMGTSGAETLSAAANVFMGQTEAPLIVKPYVERMTQSELLALMVGGMATISGGVMAVYIQMGADPVAILATSVMAAPCGLYLAKLLLPETEEPLTRGVLRTAGERPHRNVIDAASAGASDGLVLALNIAAMLIAFLALLAMVDYLLKLVHPDLGLSRVFGALFGPVAYLMGVERGDLGAVGDLLGVKLVANEFVAYTELTTTYRGQISERSLKLATFALTGFANFSSIGIQLGGIGGMAPSRRADIARLGLRALLAGFLATLVNASLAGALME